MYVCMCMGDTSAILAFLRNKYDCVCVSITIGIMAIVVVTPLTSKQYTKKKI